MSQTQSLIFQTTEAAPSRMGGATGAAERPAGRSSLLDRLIEERRRGDCAEPRRPRPAAAPAAVPGVVASPAPPAAPESVSPPPTPLADGERSLDELVSATWESLATAETASCFVCGGDLLPRFGAGARPVGGRCSDCGSELS